MFYETDKNDHGLKYNPFKSCIVPRPIAWITTISNDNIHNCAPYSFFNGVAADPPMVMYATNGIQPMGGHKDTISNIRDNKEFVVNIVTFEAKDKMNETTAPFNPDESEIDFAKLDVLESKLVAPVRLESNKYNGMIIGHVIGIHINDDVLKDGRIDLEKIKPLSRLGYMDYSVVDNIFEMARPKGSPRPDKVIKNRKDYND